MKIDGVSALEFRDASFTYSGREYRYQDVTSVVFSATITKHSVNFVPTGESYVANLVVALGRSSIAVKADVGFFGGLKKNGLEGLWRAKEVLSEITFSQRLLGFETELRERDYFRYGSHQFHRDGDIFHEGRRLTNVKSADARLRLQPFQLQVTYIDASRYLAKHRPRTLHIDISSDRDCLLFMLKAAYGFTFQNEAIREKRIATHRTFLQAVLTLGAKMAASDGSVNKAELDVLKAHFRINPDEFPDAGEIFNQALKDNEPVHSVAARLAQSVGRDSDALSFILVGLAQIASIDREVHPNERLILSEVGKGFGFSKAQIEHLSAIAGIRSEEPSAPKSRTHHEVIHHLKVLGLATGATVIEIKTAYKALVKGYHPDTVRAQGLPEGEVTRSEEMLKTITVSYAWLQRHHAT